MPKALGAIFQENQPCEFYRCIAIWKIWRIYINSLKG
jgi:hypothetical protein